MILPEQRAIYRIWVKGLLDTKWTGWFEGLAVIPQADGSTLLAGPVIDQSALSSVLGKIFDLGLILLRVEQGFEIGNASS